MTVAVCVRAPLVPVIVNVYEPTGDPEPDVTESVDDDVAGFVEKPDVAPVGRPLTLRFTWPLKPFVPVIVIP